MGEEKNYVRPSWDDYFMEITKMVASRGTCDRGRSGCVITKNKRIISTGYVGSPIGTTHCDDVGHEMHTVKHDDGKESMHCIRTTHAEQNAIVQAARVGSALEGATIYCKMTPCYVCAKMIINAGIKRVVCEKDYHGGGRSKEIFAEAGIRYNLLNPEMETYANMTPEDNVEVKKENKTPNPTEETISEPTIEDIPFDDKSF
jgi:dCMP deaminase